MSRSVSSCLASAILAMGVCASPAHGAATINIINGDAPGVGFNDPTPVAPVGGNPGATIGAQRLAVFNQAAAIWGAALDSTVTINVQATWEPLACTATGATLGSAGAVSISSDFANAPFSATWYHGALANKLAQTDLDPASNDLRARFNINLGNTGCLTGSGWYYGFDHNEGTKVDFLAVLLHEMSHGLGFQTFTSGSTGAYFSGPPAQPSAFDHFLRDETTGLLWSDPTETAAQRVASAITGTGLTWNGANADAYGTAHLATPELLVSGGTAADGSYVVGTASFGAPLSTAGVTATMELADDGVAPGNDACTALTGFTAGHVCVVDRGTCAFVIKAAMCQAAGGVGMVVADNDPASAAGTGMSGTDPTVTIPSVRVTQASGTVIKANLPATGTLRLDLSRPAGMNAAGRMLMYAPNPLQPGSSVSHWDVSVFPNLLMEPAINADLDGSLDATLEVMRDIGWFTTVPVELMRFQAE